MKRSIGSAGLLAATQPYIFLVLLFFSKRVSEVAYSVGLYKEGCTKQQLFAERLMEWLVRVMGAAEGY